MKKLIYKFIKMFFLVLLILVLTVFVMLMLKRFSPQVAAVLPFNKELSSFEVTTKIQVQKFQGAVNSNIEVAGIDGFIFFRGIQQNIQTILLVPFKQVIDNTDKNSSEMNSNIDKFFENKK